METKKALLIRNGNDTDLILHDGSYAFLYISEGKVKSNLYQGRIQRKIVLNDNIEDVASENCDKKYFAEYEGTSLTFDAVNESIKWLMAGSTISDFEVKVVELNDIDYAETVNNFLIHLNYC